MCVYIFGGHPIGTVAGRVIYKVIFWGACSVFLMDRGACSKEVARSVSRAVCEATDEVVFVGSLVLH